MSIETTRTRTDKHAGELMAFQAALLIAAREQPLAGLVREVLDGAPRERAALYDLNYRFRAALKTCLRENHLLRSLANKLACHLGVRLSGEIAFKHLLPQYEASPARELVELGHAVRTVWSWKTLLPPGSIYQRQAAERRRMNPTVEKTCTLDLITSADLIVAVQRKSLASAIGMLCIGTANREDYSIDLSGGYHLSWHCIDHLRLDRAADWKCECENGRFEELAELHRRSFAFLAHAITPDGKRHTFMKFPELAPDFLDDMKEAFRERKEVLEAEDESWKARLGTVSE